MRILSVLLIPLLISAFLPDSALAAPQAAKSSQELSKLASVSGVVSASKPFKAAQVYFRNVDRRITYMVYTAGGHYQAMDLLPGNYELSVRAKGLQSDIRKITLASGHNAAPGISLNDAGDTTSGDVELVSFDQMYPPGPGRDLARATCIGCHGPNFLPSRQWTSEQWKDAVEMMTRFGFVNFSADKTEILVDWLTKSFGPDSKLRGLKWDTDMPVDESKLTKAMYVEYYLRPDPVENGASSSRRGRRGQDPHFDQQGNVWFTDRSTPNRLCRLDPRTGEIKEWVLPNPKGDVHALTIDSNGVVWTSELRGNIHLNAFDPKTEKFQSWEIDPEHKLGNRIAYDTMILDGKENPWMTLIYGNALAKFDRESQKFSLFPVPTQNALPYGIDIDTQGNIWIAEFVAGKIAKFDPQTEKWSEYPALTQPSKIRRMSVDTKGTVWYGVYSAGKIGRLDPTTGAIKEVDVPQQFSQPYDVWPDPQGNMWVSDNGQGGTLIKYEPNSGSFTYYPTPQLTDQPKLDITRDGAVWYCPRTARESGVGVLYPDMTKIRTMGAYYAHGIENGSKYLGVVTAHR